MDAFFSMDGARELEGTVVGDCSLEQLLGIGGLGPVYRAYDRVIGGEVALRRIFPARSFDLATWRGELDALAGLDVPTVARVRRVFEADGVLHVGSELVRPSESLMDRVHRDGALAPAEVARLGIAVLGGLCAMHEVGALHRALDPRQILIRPTGEGVIVDGEPPRVHRDDRGALVGNPTFIAMETISGSRRHVPQSDLYGLGCSLYLALTGRAPYHDAGVLIEMMRRKLGQVPARSVREDAPAETPAPLLRLVDGLMDPDPARRPAPAEARGLLLDALC